MLAHQQVVERCDAVVQDEVGDGCHLDVDEFHVVAVLRGFRVELDRLEPLVQHLALQLHVVAVVKAHQPRGQRTVATQCLDVGLAVLLGVSHPFRRLVALLGSYAIEERYAGLLVDGVAGVYHVAVHRRAELQLAAQLGMIDDMRAVGLQHVLDDTDGLGIVVLVDGLLGQLLVAQETW